MSNVSNMTSSLVKDMDEENISAVNMTAKSKDSLEVVDMEPEDDNETNETEQEAESHYTENGTEDGMDAMSMYENESNASENESVNSNSSMVPPARVGMNYQCRVH